MTSDGGPLSGAVLVEAGAEHTCAATETTVWCWGANGAAQLGAGLSAQKYALAVQVAGVPFPGAIAAGTTHTCLTPSLKGELGQVWCWGKNGDGQFGSGQSQTGGFGPTPISMAGLGWNYFADAVAGHGFTCMRDFAFTHLYCWGKNNHGQLGYGGDAEKLADDLPVTWSASAPMALSQIGPVDAGYEHVCAVAETNGPKELYCWGSNSKGQLGIDTSGQKNDSNLAAQVSLDDVAAVSAGRAHTCAVQSSGKVFCWGDNQSGQLGVAGLDEKVLVPTQLLCPQ